RAVARVAAVQMIAGLERLLHLRRLRGIAERRVEVEHAVELLARPHPVVDGLAYSVAVGRVVPGALVRRDRRAVDLEALRVRPRDNLPVAGDHRVPRRLDRGRRHDRRDRTLELAEAEP